MNVLEKFIELTKEIHSYGSEERMQSFLPEGIEQDEVGNYYLEIGQSRSIFTAHLDTVSDYDVEQVNHIVEEEDNRTIVRTDETTILGADDRSGVLVLLYMIENRIPGLYYFFIGEEVGRIGSQAIADLKPEFFSDYDRCISFDRRGFGSIISEQSGETCCSQTFVQELAYELSTNSSTEFCDDTFGSYTDSYSFTHLIAECTNISVGYSNAHWKTEFQDITYLEELCRAVVKVNWEALPVRRMRLVA